jgi:hypothetical protein
MLKPLQFFALVFTALALVPGGAHLFAVANKLDLARDPYFVAQSVYRGWSWFGVVWFGALSATAALLLELRGERTAFAFAVFALLCLVAMNVVFFVWTYPANLATDNWTTMPSNWETLRSQWELSHVASAVIAFAAFCSVVLSVVTTRRQPACTSHGGDAPH